MVKGTSRGGYKDKPGWLQGQAGWLQEQTRVVTGTSRLEGQAEMVRGTHVSIYFALKFDKVSDTVCCTRAFSVTNAT